jgi:hypothetical protein
LCAGDRSSRHPDRYSFSGRGRSRICRRSGTVAACRVGRRGVDYDTLQELMALGFRSGLERPRCRARPAGT